MSNLPSDFFSTDDRAPRGDPVAPTKEDNDLAALLAEAAVSDEPPQAIVKRSVSQDLELDEGSAATARLAAVEQGVYELRVKEAKYQAGAGRRDNVRSKLDHGPAQYSLSAASGSTGEDAAFSLTTAAVIPDAALSTEDVVRVLRAKRRRVGAGPSTSISGKAARQIETGMAPAQTAVVVMEGEEQAALLKYVGHKRPREALSAQDAPGEAVGETSSTTAAGSQGEGAGTGLGASAISASGGTKHAESGSKEMGGAGSGVRPDGKQPSGGAEDGEVNEGEEDEDELLGLVDWRGPG